TDLVCHNKIHAGDICIEINIRCPREANAKDRITADEAQGVGVFANSHLRCEVSTREGLDESLEIDLRLREKEQDYPTQRQNEDVLPVADDADKQQTSSQRQQRGPAKSQKQSKANYSEQRNGQPAPAHHRFSGENLGCDQAG